MGGDVLQWAIGDIMGKHGFHMLGAPGFTAHYTSYVVSNVCIYAGPVDCCTCRKLHFLGALVAFYVGVPVFCCIVWGEYICDHI